MNEGDAPSLPASLAECTARLRPDLLDRLTKTMLATDPAVYAAAWAAIAEFDALDRLSGIRCPSLVLVGDEDHDTPLAASTVLAQSIPGAEMIVIEGASRMLSMEAPERFSEEPTRSVRAAT